MTIGTGPEDQDSDQWRKWLVEGERAGRIWRRVVRNLPSNPRCKLCLGPFSGIGGRLFRLTGFAPSRKNPRFCNGCFEAAPMGGAEAEIGILFADVRGFTAFSEARTPPQVAAMMKRFYAVAVDVLSGQDAIIDKLVGDEVMALYIRGFTGEDYMEKMAASAEGLLQAVGYGSPNGAWLPLGVGMDFGPAFVGNVGSGEVKDFTALGDVVNTAARLNGAARPGEIVMSERVYAQIAGRYPAAERVELDLKGKSEPVVARRVEYPLVGVAPIT
jgi:adenylate cyclase